MIWIEAILDGIYDEYNVVNIVIQYREGDKPCPVIIAYAMLLLHERTSLHKCGSSLIWRDFLSFIKTV